MAREGSARERKRAERGDGLTEGIRVYSCRGGVGFETYWELCEYTFEL